VSLGRFGWYEPSLTHGSSGTSGTPWSLPVKYAKVERERRWLLDGLPPFPDDARQVRIVDRYLHGTRLRLREVTETDGTVVRKLGHKVRLGDDASEVACTSLYLDDAEWAALSALPGDVLTKLRVFVPHGEHAVALDVFEAPHRGLVIAEIDAGDGPAGELPPSYAVVREVTSDERYTGAGLAHRGDGHGE
jgi:CYTH domain-containing protein